MDAYDIYFLITHYPGRAEQLPVHDRLMVVGEVASCERLGEIRWMWSIHLFPSSF